jgi:serine phosphatase RsbU (regulator of sigma subunit)
VKQVVFFFVFFFNLLYSSKLLCQDELSFAEYNYLIQPTFKDEIVQKKLTAIFKNIILGKYLLAKKEISTFKSKTSKGSSIYRSLLSYEATISYNESNYQNTIILCDSILLKAQNRKERGYYLKALNIKAKANSALNNLETAKSLLFTSIKISKKHAEEYHLSSALYLLGSIYSDEGNYAKANESIFHSLKIKERIKDLVGSGACYAFLGLNYAHLSDYSKAISMLQKSILIREKIKDKRGLANSYLSLFNIYYDNGEKEKALKSELKSLYLCQELNDFQCISGRLTHIGELYQETNDLQLALSYHYKALKISKKINIKNRIALVHQNISKVYLLMSRFDLAIAHIDSSISLNKSIGIQDGLISAELTKSEILIKKEQFKIALPLVLNAIHESQRLKLPIISKKAHELASIIYESLMNHHLSSIHFKRFIYLKDSIGNIEKAKEITKKEFEFEYSKKEEIFKLKQRDQMHKIQQKSNVQLFLMISSIAVLLVVSVFLFITIKLNKENIISKRNLEQTNLILTTKNNEILDSITYAKRIQSAILPQEKLFKKHFRDLFILYKPKDIVAGDFYWMEENSDIILFATADCTGHGVPGAMVSVVCNNALNRSVREFKLIQPHKILDKTREIVIEEFEKSDEDVKDGMDISLCAINLQTNKLSWAGAHNPLWILRDNEMMEYKADKQPIGKYANPKPFSLIEIELKKDDLIFIFTDGFQDQFGGLKQKKFRTSQMRELFISIFDKSMEEQRQLIDASFEAWKGDLEQVDDVCVIGVKI